MIKKKTIKEWAKEHKAQLIIAGVGIVTVATGIILYKNRKVVTQVSADAINKLIDAIATIRPSAQHVTTVAEPVVQSVQVVEEITKEIAEVIPEADAIVITKAPHYTSKHIRNLAPGRKPSPDKIATALENGFHLLDNQTWVNEYCTGGVAA